MKADGEGGEDAINIRNEYAAINPFWRQFVGVIPAFLFFINDGMIFSYSATLLPQLAANDSDIVVDGDDQSWIASMPLLTMLIGCLIGGYLMQNIGCKTINIFTGLLICIAWTFIHQSYNVTTLLIGRALCGLTIGIPGAPNAVFIAEISSPKYRLVWLGMIPFGLAAGMLLGHGFGALLSWRNMALIGAGLSVLIEIWLIFIKDSYASALKKRNNLEQAAKMFYWYRGYDTASHREFTLIIDNNASMSQNKSLNVGELMNLKFLKSLATIILFFATMQFSGNKILVFYTLTLLNAILAEANHLTIMILLDVVRCVMAIIACLLSKRYKLRTLALISGYATSLSLFILSACIYYQFIYGLIAILVIYNISVAIGLLALPWALTGELFAPNTKGVGGGIATASNCACFFLVIKTTPWLTQNYGYDGAFALFGVVVFVCMAALYYLIPETKNRTLQDVVEQQG